MGGGGGRAWRQWDGGAGVTHDAALSPPAQISDLDLIWRFQAFRNAAGKDPIMNGCNKRDVSAMMDNSVTSIMPVTVP